MKLNLTDLFIIIIIFNQGKGSFDRNSNLSLGPWESGQGTAWSVGCSELDETRKGNMKEGGYLRGKKAGPRRKRDNESSQADTDPAS